jgi:hypothetical protein
MLQKLLKFLAKFRESDRKIDWLREQLKWRYFAFRHQKEARLNAVYDSLHAVDTATELPLASVGVPLTDVARGNGVYRPVTETLFRQAMASVRIDVPAFTFIDIGSGKGKVLFMASDLPFKRIIGIEYASGLHEIAVRNTATYRSEGRKCTVVDPVHADALAYTLPPGPLLLFIFNALAPDFMRALLEKLDRSAASDEGRPVILIYTNIRSVGEVGNVFDGLQNLRTVQRTRNFVVIANAGARILAH